MGKKQGTKVETPKGEIILDSKAVANAILGSKELIEQEKVIDERRKQMKIPQTVRPFIIELANDLNYNEVIAVKSREKNFIKAMYEKTDLCKAEIQFLFGIPTSTFNKWYTEERWRKLGNKQILTKDKLIVNLYAGEYNLIHVKKEDSADIKKKYNATYYKLHELAISSIEEAIPNMNLINALSKIVPIINNCYEKQLDVRNISGNARDRESILLKRKELELKEREVSALEKASSIQIVSPTSLEDDNKFTPQDVFRLFERFISEKNLDEETKEELLNAMTKEMGIEDDIELENDVDNEE